MITISVNKRPVARFAGILVILLTVSSFIPASFQAKEPKPYHLLKGYNIRTPDETWILPPQLHEISGIAISDPQTVACIQDENGYIFFYDLLKKRIKNSVIFQGNGDFEDIAKVKEEYFVLRSDRILFQVSISGAQASAKSVPLTSIPYKNLEGLWYDQKNNRLLIVPKDGAEKDKTEKGRHPVYGYDLLKKQLLPSPVYSFDLKTIRKFATDNKVVVNKNDDDHKYDISFTPSAIAIHPLTGRIYVVSGSEWLIFVFSPAGIIESITVLDRDLFTQPEGIAFFSSGDMLISNEGDKKQPTILRFKYLK